MPYYGEFAALFTAFIWSLSSFLFTAAAKKIGPLQLNVDRLILSSLFLVLTILVFSIDYSINSTQIMLLSISGIIGLLIGDSFLFKAFKEIGPRFSLLIMSCNPAIAAVFAYYVLGEILSLWSIIGMLITLTGIAVVILEKNSIKSKFTITKLGVLFALLAAIGQGVGLNFAKMAYLESDINGLTATFVRIISAWIIMLPVTIAIGRYKNPIKTYTMDKKVFLLVFLASILGPYIGVTLSFEAVTHTKVGIASTLLSTIPIMMLPLSHIIYKEHLSVKSIIGAFVAVGGIAILFLI